MISAGTPQGTFLEKVETDIKKFRLILKKI